MSLDDAARELDKQGEEVDRVVLDDYYKIYLKGHVYPLKGMPTVEAVNAINVVKDIGKKMLRQSWRAPKKTLEQFVNLTYPIITPYLPPKLVPVAREVERMIGGRLGTVLASVLELDSSYRARFQDMMSSTSQYGWRKRPLRTLWKAVQINRRRDYAGVHRKIRFLAFFIALHIITHREAWERAFKECDYAKLCYDQGDLYWASKRTDYNINA